MTAVHFLLVGSLAFAPTVHKPMDLSLRVLPALTPMKAPSRDSRTHRIVRASLLVIGAALDIHSTRVAMGMPELREAHSWLYGTRAPLWRLLAVKGAINGVTWLGSNKAASAFGPVEGFMPVAISTSWQTWAAVGNYRLIHKIKTGGAR